MRPVMHGCKINEKQAFGDDQTKPVILEFYAKFNDANKFEEWYELKDVITKST